MSVSVIAKNTCFTTGEGPYWEEATKSLVYVDITQGDVHRWSSITNEDTSLHLGLIYSVVNVIFHSYRQTNSETTGYLLSMSSVFLMEIPL